MATIVSSRSLNNITTAQNPEPPDRRPSDGDIDIAQGLLVGPRIPTRKYSLSQFVVGNNSRTLTCGSMDDKSASFESMDELPHQYVIHTSNTWTSSSGEAPSDRDEIDLRSKFLDEYNRLANKHGVRALSPKGDEAGYDLMTEKPNWFKRNILGRTSSAQSMKGDKQLKHRRSISDLSGRLKFKKDTLKDKSLQELVRLCGISLLYLPAEYTSRSLALPTCFRATAQYLVQYGVNSRGIFRIPGSHSVVIALYNHYGSLDEDGDVVAGTVRCPTLPSHIKCDVYDVASAFKKFLAGLPDGILGSLSVFYSLVSIHGQLLGDPELTKTKQTKIRGRLIALAILTLKSQYRRDLICAVFGLLSMIGRAAEIAPREDDHGRPLPTSDLMGYAPLGIVFGPLLLGELLDNYTMRVANPHGPLVLLPVSPPKCRREKHSRTQKDQTQANIPKRRKSSLVDEGVRFSTQIDKVKVANEVTEMLITHWRDVVRHLKALQPSRSIREVTGAISTLNQHPLRPSASESFTLRKPPDWGGRQVDGAHTTPTRGSFALQATKIKHRASEHHDDSLVVKKQRGGPRHVAGQKLTTSKSMSVLSPTQEELSNETSDQQCPSLNQNQEILEPITSESRSLNQKENQSFKEATIRKSSVQFRDDTKNVQPETADHIDEMEQFENTNPVEKLEHARKLSSAKKPGLKVTITRSAAESNVSENRRRRATVTDPGNWPLKPAKTPGMHLPRGAEASRYLRGLESGDGAGLDPLESIPRQEDLASLAALASALKSSKSMANAIESVTLDEQQSRSQKSMKFVRKHFRSGSATGIGQSKGSCSPKAKSNSPSSPQRLLKVFGSQKNRHSNKTSSTVDTSFSTSSKPHSGLVSTLESKNTTPCSDIVDGKLQPRTPSPGKLVKSQVPITKLGTSPYGTVRALAAKFDTVDLNPVHTPSPTKSPLRGSSHYLPMQSGSPKKAVVAAYTINEVSPAKSYKSDTTRLPELSPVGSKSAEASVLAQRDALLLCNRSPSPYLSAHNNSRDGVKSPITKHTTSRNTTPNKSTSHSFSVGQCVHDYVISMQGSSKSSSKYLGRIPSPLTPLPLQLAPSSSNSNSSQDKGIHYSTADNQYIKGSSTSRPVSLPALSIISGMLSTSQKPAKEGPLLSRSSHGSPGFLPKSKHIYELKTVRRSSPSMPRNSTPYHTQSLKSKTSDKDAGANDLLVEGSSASLGLLRWYDSASKAPQIRTLPTIHKLDERPLPSSRSYPIPTRSNSVLSAQVQAFRKELELKSNEIRNLKQRLNSRTSLPELGVLSQELKTAREEILIWKSRAHAAEKQVEILTNVTARAPTGCQPNVGTLSRSKAQYSSSDIDKEQEEKELTRSRRSRRFPELTIAGLDGAVSPPRTVSGGSSDTVIRIPGM